MIFSKENHIIQLSVSFLFYSVFNEHFSNLTSLGSYIGDTEMNYRMCLCLSLAAFLGVSSFGSASLPPSFCHSL